MTEQSEVIRVKNKETGLIHTVLPGHFSLDDPDDYEVVKKKSRKRRRKKSGDKES